MILLPTMFFVLLLLPQYSMWSSALLFGLLLCFTHYNCSTNAKMVRSSALRSRFFTHSSEIAASRLNTLQSGTTRHFFFASNTDFYHHQALQNYFASTAPIIVLTLVTDSVDFAAITFIIHTKSVLCYLFLYFFTLMLL